MGLYNDVDDDYDENIHSQPGPQGPAGPQVPPGPGFKKTSD